MKEKIILSNCASDNGGSSNFEKAPSEQILGLFNKFLNLVQPDKKKLAEDIFSYYERRTKISIKE